MPCGMDVYGQGEKIFLECLDDLCWRFKGSRDVRCLGEACERFRAVDPAEHGGNGQKVSDFGGQGDQVARRLVREVGIAGMKTEAEDLAQADLNFLGFFDKACSEVFS